LIFLNIFLGSEKEFLISTSLSKSLLCYSNVQGFFFKEKKILGLGLHLKIIVKQKQTNLSRKNNYFMINKLFRQSKLVGVSKTAFLPSAWKNRVYFPMFKFSVIEEGTDATKLLEEVEGKVLQAIKSRSSQEFDKINRAATFEELGFDSLDTVDIVVSIEEMLRLDIGDEEAIKIKTPNDAIALFHRYVLERYNKNKLAQRKKRKDLVVTEEEEEKDINIKF